MNGKSVKHNSVVHRAGNFAYSFGWMFFSLFFATSQWACATTVRQQPWGNGPAGDPVSLFTIDAGNAQLQLTNYGARIVAIRVPDRTGHVANVVLTEEHPDSYKGTPGAVMGATIGRYANRIAGGQFDIDGVSAALIRNNGQNTLHGGPAGFNSEVWQTAQLPDGVAMTLISPDGDMGFPGQVTLRVSFHLTNTHGKASVALDYEATTTQPTVVNFTNHSFFNLSGNPDTPVLNDLLTIAAKDYTPVKRGLPTGALEPVAGTPLDFQTPRTFGSHIPDRGYDNNFVLVQDFSTPAATVDDPATGRTLSVYTTEPGLQLFVPHSVPHTAQPTTPGPPGFPPVQGFCLETEHFPDSPHHPNFPTTTLRPGQTFHSKTVYSFSTSNSTVGHAQESRP